MSASVRRTWGTFCSAAQNATPAIAKKDRENDGSDQKVEVWLQRQQEGAQGDWKSPPGVQAASNQQETDDPQPFEVTGMHVEDERLRQDTCRHREGASGRPRPHPQSDEENTPGGHDEKRHIEKEKARPHVEEGERDEEPGCCRWVDP